MFGRLVDVMETTRADILGDLFQGAITYGEAGQYLTPESITSVMAAMSANLLRVRMRQRPGDPGWRHRIADVVLDADGCPNNLKR